jgi:uncharacterized protein
MMERIYSALVTAAEMPGASFALFILTILGAALVRGLTGFGFAILAVPLMSLVIAPAQAVLLALVLQMLIGPFGVRSSLPLIDRRVVGTIAAVAAITTPLGLWLLTLLDADTARLLIAAIAFVCFFGFLVKRAPTPNRALPHLIATGTGSGLLNGFAAMPGPPVILYFVRDGVAPLVARGSMMLVFFAAAVSGTVTAALRDLLNLKILALTLFCFPVMLIGNHIGSRFFGRISEPVWRGGVIVLLGIAMIGAFAKL